MFLFFEIAVLFKKCFHVEAFLRNLTQATIPPGINSPDSIAEKLSEHRYRLNHSARFPPIIDPLSL